MIKYALLLSLMACDDVKTDDTGDGATTAGAPQEGHWTTSATTTSDTCGMDTTGDTGDTGGADDAGMTLAMTDSSTFTVTFDQTDAQQPSVLTCHLSGQEFTCDTMTEDNPIDGFDATINVSQDVSGQFPTWTTLTGTAALSVSCTGADCETVTSMAGLTLPCESVMSLEGQAD